MALLIDRREELRYLHCEVCLTTESIRRFTPKEKESDYEHYPSGPSGSGTTFPSRAVER